MNSVEILNLFSESYIESRNKFLSAAKKRHLAIDHYISPFKGINQEELAIDVVYEGEVNASKLLIILSGVHGVEGFTGSAIQTGLLSSTLNLPHDIAILYIHAVNPYGFSHLRRVNEDNVDLNRNFINFAENLPENKEYSKIHNALLPPIYPFEQDEQLNHYQVIHGEKSLQYAITLGQHHFPDGMYFGGFSPTWSNTTIRHILKKYTPNVPLIASIDIHTGLGPYGLGEKIFASFDPNVFKKAQNWWGEITSVHTGSSTSIPMTGPIQVALTEECAHAEHIGICLEYGTYPLDKMINTLRADHWAYRYKQFDTVQGNEIRKNLKDTFYPDDPEWKNQIWKQAHNATLQALSGLKNNDA